MPSLVGSEMCIRDRAEDILHRLTETHLTELRSIASNLIALLKALTRADTAE